MGSKKKKPPRRSPNSSAKSRFPLGELSREKAKLRHEYLSKNKELCALKNYGCLFISPPSCTITRQRTASSLNEWQQIHSITLIVVFRKAESNDKCYYCGHPFMAEVSRSVKEGKPTKDCLKYLSWCTWRKLGLQCLQFQIIVIFSSTLDANEKYKAYR